jgi:hypothetical protein
LHFKRPRNCWWWCGFDDGLGHLDVIHENRVIFESRVAGGGRKFCAVPDLPAASFRVVTTAFLHHKPATTSCSASIGPRCWSSFARRKCGSYRLCRSKHCCSPKQCTYLAKYLSLNFLSAPGLSSSPTFDGAPRGLMSYKSESVC